MNTKRPNFLLVPASLLIWTMVVGLALVWGSASVAKAAIGIVAAAGALYLLWRLFLLALWIFAESRYRWRMRDPVFRANRELISRGVAGIEKATQQIVQDWQRLAQETDDGRIIASASAPAKGLRSRL